MLKMTARAIAWIIARLHGFRYKNEWYVPHPLGDVTLVVYHVRKPLFGRFWGITLCDTLVTTATNYVRVHAMHEATHTHQCRRYGWLFPLLYLLASIKALPTGKPYWNNAFEIEARTYEEVR